MDVAGTKMHVELNVHCENIVGSSHPLQHWRQVCVEFQALWDVWKRAAQSGGLHPG